MVRYAWILVALCLCLCVSGVSGFIVDKTNVTSVTNMGATLSANTTACTPFTYYFDIGTSSGKYQSRTKTITTNSTAFSSVVSGLPIYPSTTYYYRPVVTSGGATAYGAEDSFTTLARTAVANTAEIQGHADSVWTLIDFEYDPLDTSEYLVGFWDNAFGQLFFGIVFAIVFLTLWIRMADITIPLLVGIITGTTMISLMPPEWQQVGIALFALSLAGYLYILFKKRRVEQ